LHQVLAHISGAEDWREASTLMFTVCSFTFSSALYNYRVNKRLRHFIYVSGAQLTFYRDTRWTTAKHLIDL